MRVDEHTITIDHVPVFYRSVVAAGSSAPTRGGGPPVLYLHGTPTSSQDWIPFLERTGGLAPDLIGFGRSGKGGHLDYSPDGLTDFIERFLAELEIDRVKLVGHGWGAALGLLMALRQPARIERLVLIDAVPLLEGFRWHGAVRLWRRRVIGELLMGATSRRLLDRELRRGSTQPNAWTEPRLEAVWEQFDQGTQRALLRLHRAADEHHLAELGGELGSVTAPALIVWGEQDPWFAARFADAYGARLAAAQVERVPGAGHWPWLDQPRVVERVADFLAPR